MARRPLLLVVLLAAFGAAACGKDEPSEAQGDRAVLALDFIANAVHAPLYAAVREGFDRKRGVNLDIESPGSGPDGLKLLAAGKVDVAVLDIHDLGIAREQGADVVGIAALVERPLAAILARPGIDRPRELTGKRIGVSGLPSDPAVLSAVMRDDGADLRRAKQITIGFNAVPNMLGGQVDAVPAFWNAEGVALRERGLEVNEFRVEDHGAPRYPEVVLVTTRRTLRAKRRLLEGVVKAVGDGVRSVQRDPEAAIADIAKAGAANPSLVRAQLAAVSPAFSPAVKLDRRVLEAWAAWDADVGILARRPVVDETFAFGLAD